MKIYADTIPLNPNGEEPKNFCLDMRRKIQTEYAIDSVNAKIFDRGNSKITLSFTIEQAHPEEALAEFFAVAILTDKFCRNPITLTIKTDSANFALSNASLSRIKSKAEGIITITDYEWSGEKIVKI